MILVLKGIGVEENVGEGLGPLKIILALSSGLETIPENKWLCVDLT